MMLYDLTRLAWSCYVLVSLIAVNVIMLCSAIVLLPFSALQYRIFNERLTTLLWPFWSYGSLQSRLRGALM